jgi:hypothetical protein
METDGGIRFSDYERFLLLKDDWETTRRHHESWWAREGLVFWITAPRGEHGGWKASDEPDRPADLDERWYGAEYRARAAEYAVSQAYYGGDAFPIAPGWSAAGDLGVFLGARVELEPRTVWMHASMDEPGDEAERGRVIELDRSNEWLVRHYEMVRLMVEQSRGRFFIGMPDLVENIDVLASLRGTEPLLMDMVDRPDWVERRVREINDAFFEAFDLFYDLVRDQEGGNTFVFNLWGPGRTAKVQCDACSMFGPAMFRRFVTPALTDQCAWLDYSMFHLDGESCLPNLDALLEIEPLDAIEWTPSKLSVGDTGGMPKWYDLYRRILAGGKSVQAIGVRPDEVIPLLDACGGKGMFITCHAETEDEARELEERIHAYR